MRCWIRAIGRNSYSGFEGEADTSSSDTSIRFSDSNTLRQIAPPNSDMSPKINKSLTPLRFSKNQVERNISQERRRKSKQRPQQWMVIFTTYAKDMLNSSKTHVGPRFRKLARFFERILKIGQDRWRRVSTTSLMDVTSGKFDVKLLMASAMSNTSSTKLSWVYPD